MNIANLDKLIAHLEAQPPEQINMGWVEVAPHSCGTCGCIKGHADLVWPSEDIDYCGLYTKVFQEDVDDLVWHQLTVPVGWHDDAYGAGRYPAHRVIATLKRLRDTYLATGQVVVDWGPEPGDEPKTPWVTPQVAEVIAPALPAEITSLLRPSAVKMEA